MGLEVRHLREQEREIWAAVKIIDIRPERPTGLRLIFLPPSMGPSVAGKCSGRGRLHGAKALEYRGRGNVQDTSTEHTGYKQRDATKRILRFPRQICANEHHRSFGPRFYNALEG